MTSRTVHIAGMLIHAKPEALELVAAVVRRCGDADMQPTGVPGKLAVAIECAHERDLADCVEQFHAIPGVISVSITSHYIEDAASLAAELP